MKYNIRKYTSEDFEMLTSWWEAANEPAPDRDTTPEESTFILELDDKPVMTIAAFLTNTRGMSYIENFVAAPDFDLPIRKEAAQLMVFHVCNFVKALGYKRICCFAYREKLARRYEELGMTRTLDNVSTFAKELS